MIAAAAFAFLFAATVQTADQAPANPPENVQAASQAPAAQPQDMHPDDVVQCRREAATGSRLSTTRVCMSRNDERRLREESAHTMREIRSSSINGTSE